ncbi:hypothetical protein [Candidatus Symbiopectobacterium sp.]|uniref:hypothetical protein n=1 Tax=Candidatus Symbiopectobacterium sp. TaxID=2816440 RepID=UPI0025BCAB2B|nr:hypothetical protein [Candidatus Symbiopectobacterium sp.]
MATFAINVFFHRRCLFTKRAPYINFSHCIPHPKPDISHCNQHIEYMTKMSGKLFFPNIDKGCVNARRFALIKT